MPETEDGAQGLAKKSTCVRSLITPAPFLSSVAFLGSNTRFAAFPRLLPPSSPPNPLLPQGRRGSLGVLMPETEDGAQGLPQKPTPVRCPFSHEGRRGSLGVLMPL
jgi:hypothetical protein